MKGKRRGFWIFLIILLILVLLGGGIFFVLRYQPRPRNIAPTITILSPANPATVPAGGFLYIKTNAMGSAGIKRIDFSVDGSPYRYQESGEEPMLVMPADFSWQADNAGTHTLTFIATDSEGNTSPPATLEVLVINEVASAEIPSDGGIVIPGGVDIWAGDEIEQVIERIEENAAADAGQLVDDAQPLEENAEQQADDGGEAEQGEVQLQDARPTVQLLDGSMRDGGGLHILVKVTAQDDIGVNKINVRFGRGIAMESQFYACGGAQQCEQIVEYQLNGGESDLHAWAFDTRGQISELAALHFQIAQGQGDQPPAIVVDEDFDPADLEVIQDEIEQEEREQLDDFGAPRITGYECGGNVVRIGVPYRYYSNNGRQIYAGGFAGLDGSLIAAGWVPVEQGTNGFIQFDMETTSFAEAGISTSGMTLQMMNEIGDPPFYAEHADLTITWPQPKPDLVITDVQRSINGTEIDVTVQNRGCADVEGFKLATYLTPDARHTEKTFPNSVPTGSSQTVKFFSLDPNAYAYGFSVVVDPDDTIDEIDDLNNVFQKFPIQIKYIHFDKIDIHDTSDGEATENSDKGEFRIFFAAHDARAVRPNNNADFVWKMGIGTHTIDGIIVPVKLTPNLPLDRQLTIVVDLEEDDFFAPNDLAKAVAELSADMNNPDSWKRGHGQDRSITASNGRFTIHYWVVLDF